VTPDTSLAGKVAIVTGASRGIGKAIAKRLAQEGVLVVAFAKSSDAKPNQKLDGTVEQTVREIHQAGGRALSFAGDIRDETDIMKVIDQTVETFGGIDILVNNAGAVNLAPTRMIDTKKLDLMMAINYRGPYTLIRWSLWQLTLSSLSGRNPHILNIAPPVKLHPTWFQNHTPYTISKYALSMLTYGLAMELRDPEVTVTSLWPRKIIATDALRVIGHVDPSKCRTPEIMADAAHAVLSKWLPSGQQLTDEAALEVLAEIKDFDHYSVVPGTPQPDLINEYFLY
jgi:citronellol/citronellal dehydrogenase